MDWLFGKKRDAASRSEPPGAQSPPPGEGWRRWFEVSVSAATDPPWNYEWVELWRPNWDNSRVTRSTDVPYEEKGPGFWWRPWVDRTAGPPLIESDDAARLAALSPKRSG